MTKTVRARYTLEFKQEAVRLVHGGQSIAAAARTLGVVEQTLFNWVKADRQGKLTGADSKVVSAEQMEISRLRAELARVKMERDILGKARAYLSILILPFVCLAAHRWKPLRWTSPEKSNFYCLPGRAGVFLFLTISLRSRPNPSPPCPTWPFRS